MSSEKQLGQENRDSILPTMDVSKSNYTPPKYDIGGQVPTPNEVGVRRGGSFGAIASASKGMRYYVDVIGFGQSSSDMTEGLPFNKIGLNYFMPSGLRCSNGADMWTYFEGIPTGNMLGPRVASAMSAMGLPQMRGLAPGMMEDVQSAMNPGPILQAAFGNVYPVCEKRKLPVGDDAGRIQDPYSGDVWIEGPIEYINGRPHQEKWVQAMKGSVPVYVTQQQWKDTPKTMNPDGTPKPAEGFENGDNGRKESLVLAIVLFSLAVAFGSK